MWLRFVKAGVRLVEWQTTMLLMPTLYKDNRTKSKRPTRRYNIPGFQNPVELQPLRAKDGCTGVGFLHDMGSRVLGLDVADLTFNALLCRRDAAIAIDVHASPFWLKDNERHF